MPKALCACAFDENAHYPSVDLAISSYFSEKKYPEFTFWKPLMDKQIAAQYVEDSTVQSCLFHETFPGRADGIRLAGVNVGLSTQTVHFAAGHYMAVHRDYVADRFGSKIIRQKALIKRPFRVSGQKDFMIWQERMGLLDYDWPLLPRLSTLELLEQGFDGMHIKRDTDGAENSESWLAFHPRQVVTLPHECD